MDLQLKGKRALVTGSSLGIGVGIARMLREEGCAVVVHGRNRERTEKVASALSLSVRMKRILIVTRAAVPWNKELIITPIVLSV